MNFPSDAELERLIRKHDDESFTHLAVWLVKNYPAVAREWLAHRRKMHTTGCLINSRSGNHNGCGCSCHE